MVENKWNYMLRMLGRNPDNIPMDRLGEYIREFAELLGTDNHPIFKGIKKASTGLKAAIPSGRRQHAKLRLVQARTDPESRPGRQLQIIEGMLTRDSIKEAQLLDANESVVLLLRGHLELPPEAARLHQDSFVDGVVTGLVGADDTMHLHLRDHFDRDLRLIVRDELLARELLVRFRNGSVRVYACGTWIRGDFGWIPEASKCTVSRFEVLDETPPASIFKEIAASEGNGWLTLDDPLSEWKRLRGLN